MYNFFYRNFKAGAMQDPMTIIWGSFAAAVCAGCLTCRRMPAFDPARSKMDIRRGRPVHRYDAGGAVRRAAPRRVRW